MAYRYLLTLSYDGTAYCGWQVQKTGTSIQSLVQKALQIVLRHATSLTGAGRTDAGVHALGQTAHFDSDQCLDCARCRYSINALLPPTIRILQIEPVRQDFHARYSALAKIYHYHLHLGCVLDPFIRLYRHQVIDSCNFSAISRAIPHFLGTRDFLAFANHADRGTAAHDAVRTLRRIDLVEQKGGVRLEFEADGFLYKMVRNITGSLLEVGSGKVAPEEIPLIFASKDRRRAGASAPPKGLFLTKVLYPKSHQTT
ncbi:MAG: tRNA pseudouridine(38-40) synthase TruA [Chlamydiia bacterium]|nr:tRNA pseudouridine(38-40) synthase TruA [Chlamydiia bacterium]